MTVQFHTIWFRVIYLFTSFLPHFFHLFHFSFFLKSFSFFLCWILEMKKKKLENKTDLLRWRRERERGKKTHKKIKVIRLRNLEKQNYITKNCKRTWVHFGRNFLVVMVYTSIGAFDGLSIQFFSILSHLRKQLHEFEKQIFMPQKLKLRLTVLDWINSIEYLKKGRKHQNFHTQKNRCSNGKW